MNSESSEYWWNGNPIKRGAQSPSLTTHIFHSLSKFQERECRIFLHMEFCSKSDEAPDGVLLMTVKKNWRIKRNSRKTSRNNLRAKWAGQMTLNTAVVLWNCYNSPARGFFRFGAWDRGLMLARSKYKRFGHNFRSRMLNFGHRSLWRYIYALKYFHISPERWKPQRRQQEWATRRNGYGRITWLHSHELSDIAKLQRSN